MRKRIQIPTIQTPPSYQELRVEDYLRSLAETDNRFAERLKSLGLPTEGYCRLTTIPGDVLFPGPAYKDFTVTSLAVLLGYQNDLEPGRFGIVHRSEPEDLRVWGVWLMDVVRHDSESVIRYFWDYSAGRALVTIEYINNDLHDSHEREGTTRDVIAKLKRLVPGLKLIALAEADAKRGRPEGTGWFKSAKDFRTALKEVLATQRNRPIQLHTLKLLDDHPLCQLKPQQPRNQSHTKLLRDWLHNAGLRDYDEALRLYWRSSKSGK